MKSHETLFTLKEAAKVLGAVVVPAILIASVVRLAASAQILPPPWPATDLEHTVLTHQALAARSATLATTLLVGDSSCLMDISADRLMSPSGSTALNLGTFMYVGFPGYATMLTTCLAANPTNVQRVIVLVHPEMLRGIEPVLQYQNFIAKVMSGEDVDDRSSAVAQVRGLFGLNILMNRIGARTPWALPGEYGRAYGFNLDLDAYMGRHNGSAFDPHLYRPGPAQGNADYRFSPSLESGCRILRAAVPPSTQLIAALAPIPESFAPRNYAPRAQRILAEWARALGADQALTNLSAVLPDDAFASTTHLNKRGAEAFTSELARHLWTP